MASDYPNSKDTFTNPLGSDRVDTVDHAAQHSDANDAIEAVQGYLGVTGDTDPSTITKKVTDNAAAISGKADSSHTHAQGDITGLTAELAGKIETINGEWSGTNHTISADSAGSDVGVSTEVDTTIISVPDAGPSSRGVVTAADQTFGGTKTFTRVDSPEVGNEADDISIRAHGEEKAYIDHKGILRLTDDDAMYQAGTHKSNLPKFAVAYLSALSHYGFGYLQLETSFLGINPSSASRIGFYLESPNGGYSGSALGTTVQPDNPRLTICKSGVGITTGNDSPNGALEIRSRAADETALLLKGIASQTADALRVEADDSTDPLCQIGPDGAVKSAARIAAGAVVLADGATIDLDASQGNHFTVTLGGNRTLNAPTNPLAGQRITLEIVQDGTGSRTLTLATGAGGFRFGDDPSGYTASSAADAIDLIECVYSATADRWLITDVRKGY